MTARSILVVCGLKREASLAAGPGVVAVAGGGSRPGLESRLAAIDPSSLAAVISFGFAGALDPALSVGDVVIARSVVTRQGEQIRADQTSWGAWSRKLAEDGLDPRNVSVLGSDGALLTSRAKAEARADTRADVVDMESHVAGAYAQTHHLPFAVLRAISDGARGSLPSVTGRAMRPDGSIDVFAVLAGLARTPGELPALLSTARDAGRAFRALRRVRGLLGPGFGLHL